MVIITMIITASRAIYFFSAGKPRDRAKNVLGEFRRRNTQHEHTTTTPTKEEALHRGRAGADGSAE
jgi:hypothetical protein